MTRTTTSNRHGHPSTRARTNAPATPRETLPAEGHATWPTATQRTSRPEGRWLDIAAGTAGAMGTVLLASKVVDHAGVLPVAIGASVAGGLGAVLLRGRWQQVAQGVLGTGVSQLCAGYLGRRPPRSLAAAAPRNGRGPQNDVLPRRPPQPRRPVMATPPHDVFRASWPTSFSSRLAKNEPTASRAPNAGPVPSRSAPVDPSGAERGRAPTTAPAMSGPAQFSSAQPRDERETAPTAPLDPTAPNEAGAPSSLHSTPARPPRPAARPTAPNERDEGAPPSAIAEETADLLRELQAMHRPVAPVASHPVISPPSRRTALGAIAARVGSLATAPLRFVGGLLERLLGPRALMLAVAIALMSLFAFVR